VFPQLPVITQTPPHPDREVAVHDAQLTLNTLELLLPPSPLGAAPTRQYVGKIGDLGYHALGPSPWLGVAVHPDLDQCAQQLPERADHLIARPERVRQKPPVGPAPVHGIQAGGFPQHHHRLGRTPLKTRVDGRASF